MVDAQKKSESRSRLDKLLLDRGLVPSRERAQALILAGKVLVNDQKIEKAGAVNLLLNSGYVGLEVAYRVGERGIHVGGAAEEAKAMVIRQD